MKIGFNEGCNRFCENHSVLEDLDLCEKYGFDYIDIQSECLDREIAAGKYTIDDLGAPEASPEDAVLQRSDLLQHEADPGGKGRRYGKARPDHRRLQQAGLQDDRCRSVHGSDRSGYR